MATIMPKKNMKKFMKKYNRWLSTDEGKEMFDVSAILKKTMGNPLTLTRGVKPNTIQAVAELFAPIAPPPVLIKIVPKCLNNQCFKNADLIMEHSGYMRRTGYNLTSCDCGNIISLEVHCLNEDENGNLFDLTSDYGGEKKKWFFPIENFDEKYINIVSCKRAMGYENPRNLDIIQFDIGCNCGRGAQAKVNCEQRGENFLTIPQVRECVEEWRRCRRIRTIGEGVFSFQ